MRPWLLLAALLATTALAEDEGGARNRALSFQFLPPPIDEARYSIGVFDSKGALVRRLHENTAEAKFPAALNGLVVKWDAKDDAGKRVPNGKYELRGFAVPPLKVTGVATRGNDWLADDPRLRVTKVEPRRFGHGGLVFATAQNLAGERLLIAIGAAKVRWVRLLPLPDFTGWWLRSSEQAVRIGWGDVASNQNRQLNLDSQTGKEIDGEDAAVPLDDDPGSPWSLADSGARQAVEGKPIRELPNAPNEPPLTAVIDNGADLIATTQFAPAANWQRVRILKAAPDKGGWEPIFERNIRVPLTWPTADAAPTLNVELVRNPFVKRGRTNPVLALQPLVDDRGTHLATEHGLRLRTVSEIRGVQAAALAPGAKKGAIRFFQRDAAVSEEFLVEGCDKIMGFEVGRCELGDQGEIEAPAEP